MNLSFMQPQYRQHDVPVEGRTAHEFALAQHLRDVQRVSNARQHELEVARATGYDPVMPLAKSAEDRDTTWQPSGVTGVGAWDAEQARPDPSQAMRSNIERGFIVNDNVDPGSRMSEPGVISNAYKIAGAEQALEDLGLLKSAAGISIKPLKPPKIVGKSPVKPPSINPVADLATANLSTNAGASIQSASRRAGGNPTT